MLLTLYLPYANLSTYLSFYISPYIRLCIFIYIYVCICVCIYVYVRIYVYIFIFLFHCSLLSDSVDLLQLFYLYFSLSPSFIRTSFLIRSLILLLTLFSSFSVRLSVSFSPPFTLLQFVSFLYHSFSFLFLLFFF